MLVISINILVPMKFFVIVGTSSKDHLSKREKRNKAVNVTAIDFLQKNSEGDLKFSQPTSINRMPMELHESHVRAIGW